MRNEKMSIATPRKHTKQCTHCKKYFSDKISQTSHRMFIDFAENYLLDFYLRGESSKPKKKLVSPCI